MSPSDADQEIVDFARVCVTGLKPVENNRGLIRYLLRHRHTTPFESVQVWMHVKAPIFVARQWFRHRTWSYNEVSGRYAELPDEMHAPKTWREQSKENKQGSGPGQHRSEQMDAEYGNTLLHCRGTYERFLQAGVAREQARLSLPVAQYTEWRCSVDLWNLMHFLGLRCDPHAQQEIRAYADSIHGQLRYYAPLAMDAFADYHLNAVTFSAAEMRLLKKVTQGLEFHVDEAKEAGLSSDREVREFQAKLR